MATSIRDEVRNGKTVRVRKAVRNALHQKLSAAIRAGFSADCSLDVLDVLTFNDNGVYAATGGMINCRNHTWSVFLAWSDIN